MKNNTLSKTLFAAPLQGITSAVYRTAHFEVFGGADEYFMPFWRLEKGTARDKDVYDAKPGRQRSTPVVPQILVKTLEDGKVLTDILGNMGYRRIDLNFSCPFVKVTDAGMGAAAGRSAETLRDVLKLIDVYPEISFSAKLRLEQTVHTELFQDYPLNFLTLHPRTMEQEYNGIPDVDAYWKFAKKIKIPVIYNGNVATPEAASAFSGLMIGRGMIADPGLFLKIRGKIPPFTQYICFHDTLKEKVLQENGGLDYMKRLWDYFLPELPGKYRKKIQKSRGLSEYEDTVFTAFDAMSRMAIS